MSEYGPEVRTNGNGSAHKVERVVESVWAKGLLRFGVPVILAIFAWVGAEVWHEYKLNNHDLIKKVDDIRDKMSEAARLLSIQQTEVEQSNKTTNFRFDAQGRRIDRLDSDMDEIKKRVYSIPTVNGR